MAPLSSSRPALVFDGACGFCTWTARFVKRRSREPLQIVAWQSIPLEDIGLTKAQADGAAWWIETSGEKRHGHLAVARALRACRPPWRWLGVVVDLPGIRRLSALAYGVITRNRAHLPGTEPAISRREDNSGASHG